MSPNPELTTIVTVFRSRLNPDHVGDYVDRARQIADLATAMPGYIEHKIFTADDGERVTIVEFDTEEHQQAWARHPEHRAAMAEGRDRYYLSYDLKVAEVTKHHRFAP